MVGMKWKRMFEALADPQSVTYCVGATLLARDELAEALVDMGATDDLTPFEKYELHWVLGLMAKEPGLTPHLTETLRTAMEARIPIIFEWTRRRGSCSMTSCISGGKCFITLGTPALEEAKLAAMFAGLPG